MRLLVLDLDGTLWDHEDASRLVPPLERSGDCVRDPYGETLCLFPGVRGFLEWAKERFILSIASWNVEDFVRPILEELDLWEYFTFPKIEGHPNKADMIERTVLQLENLGYTIDNVIYVDDRDIHLREIQKRLPEVEFIQMWVDVADFDELRELLENL